MPTILSPNLPLLAFAAAYMLLAVLPGPNFLVMAQASLSGRGHARFVAAVGIACGASLLALGSAVLAARLESSPALAAGGHVVFAALLATIGLRALRPRPAGGELALAPAVEADVAGVAMVFLVGFATAAANPVSAAFFSSYLLVNGAGAGAGRLPALEAAGAVFLVAVLWFGALGVALSAAPLRRQFERHRRRLDRAVGAAFVAAAGVVLLRLLVPG